MKVTLVGTNVEIAAVEAALASGRGPVLLGPEPIAAAYARISRSEKTVEELRAEARGHVEAARKSNRRIVFEMGHASIAEHAVFNFDVEGLSRLAVERLEATRLASYTERSQRYVLAPEDYVVPREIISVQRLCEPFMKAASGLFRAYHAMNEALVPRGKSALEAREDARYILPLGTTGQLGMTINARSLETTVRRLRGSRFPEMQELGAALEKEALRQTPSLIRHTEPSGLPSEAEINEEARWPIPVPVTHSSCARLARVSPRNGDNVLGPDAAARHFEHATAHDRAPRRFELVDLVWEVVCSASCFAQLKRHRVATILPEPYDPALPVVVPPSIAEAGLSDTFLAAMDAPARQFNRLAKLGRISRWYLLTNAHCRRLLLKMNLRELYHFSRLRLDAHAQWEIRGLAEQMCAQARKALPRSAAYLAGKDQWEALHAALPRSKA